MPRKFPLFAYAGRLRAHALARLLAIAALALISSSTGASVTSVEAQDAEATSFPLTQLSMSGEPGDYIGGTFPHLYRPEDSTFTPYASDLTGDGIVDYVQVSVTQPNFGGHWWYAEFTTERLGTNLAPGLYNNAMRAPFAAAGHPGLSISGDGRGCNSLTGNFRIHEIEIDYTTTPWRVVRFTASFEQHCEGGTPALLGTVYYNYSGSTPTHTISGRLAQSNGTGTGGVQVALSGSETATTTTNANGEFSFPDLIQGGHYRLTPTPGAIVISPETTSVKNLSENRSVNFTAVPIYTLGGKVTNSSGSPITGATVALSGSRTEFAVTDANGNYSFNGLRADGNYTVTPSRRHYAFTPPSRTFNTLTGNQAADFTGSLVNYTLSGRVIDSFGVGMSGVSLVLSGSRAATTQTDANGNYSFANLTGGGTYTITPNARYTFFSPGSQTFFDLGGNWASVIFTGFRASYDLGGVILDSNGNPLGGAVVHLGGAASGTTVTSNNGTYSFLNLPAGETYTVRPSKWDYVFNPSERVTSDLSEDRVLNFVGTINPEEFFVRQHYRDFFNREPDAAGLQFWMGQITECGTNQACRAVRRVNVSAAFYLSTEFQETGFLVYKTYGAAFGTRRVGSTVPLKIQEFLPDLLNIGAGIIVGQGDWQQRLEANKLAYFDSFVARPEFTSAYPAAMTAEQFVDALNANTGNSLSTAERDSLVAALASGAMARVQVLRAVAENAEFTRREKNRAFVLTQYFGYLRRNPYDPPEATLDFRGYSFWLDKLEDHNGNFVSAEMVKSFLDSGEYRGRFGQP